MPAGWSPSGGHLQRMRSVWVGRCGRRLLRTFRKASAGAQIVRCRRILRKKPGCAAVTAQPGKREANEIIWPAGGFPRRVFQGSSEAALHPSLLSAKSSRLSPCSLSRRPSATYSLMALFKLKMSPSRLSRYTLPFALMHDLAEFFYLLNVLQFHNITSHVCFWLISFSLCGQYTPSAGKTQDRKYTK